MLTEPIFDTGYWTNRLRYATDRGELHQAIFKCPKALWEQIEEKHREILKNLICTDPTDKILDCGCGWGRLLTLLPERWQGEYLGLDISPDFIARGREQTNRPGNIKFEECDLRYLHRIRNQTVIPYDWAILISMRPMIKRNMGDEVWQQIHNEISTVAYRILYLEYDPNDPGEVEPTEHYLSLCR